MDNPFGGLISIELHTEAAKHAAEKMQKGSPQLYEEFFGEDSNKDPTDSFVYRLHYRDYVVKKILAVRWPGEQFK